MAKTSSWVFGAILLIVGIWGFFAQPLGFIAADQLSSIIHVVAGIVLLALAGKPSVFGTLKTVGIVYCVFAILGFIQGSSILFGVFTTDATTNWVYLVLGVIMAVLGWSAKGGSSAPAPQM